MKSYKISTENVEYNFLSTTIEFYQYEHETEPTENFIFIVNINKLKRSNILIGLVEKRQKCVLFDTKHLILRLKWWQIVVGARKKWKKQIWRENIGRWMFTSGNRRSSQME